MNDVRGLPLDFDETKRILNNKLKIKARQIPLNYNGLTYISVNPIFFLTLDLANTINNIQRNISNYLNILGIVIFSEVLYTQKPISYSIDKHHFSIKVNEFGLCEYLIYVNNNNCKKKLSENTIKKIYKTFNKL